MKLSLAALRASIDVRELLRLKFPLPCHRSPGARWIYPLVGAVLGALTTLGFILMRAGEPDDSATALGGGAASALRAEVVGQPFAYAYLFLWTSLTLVGFGWVLGRREEELWRASRTDPSTGLANRRLLQAEVADALGEHERRRAPVSLLLIDIDGLKTINDVMGHSAGDAALALVSSAIRATCRATDLAARWGGDEFVVIARATSAAGGLELAERVRGTLKRLQIEDEHRALPYVSISIGVADVDRAGCVRPEALFFAADRALYQAKAHGRDRVVLAPPLIAVSRLAAVTSPGLRLERPIEPPRHVGGGGA